jgi:hypothetical protein
MATKTVTRTATPSNTIIDSGDMFRIRNDEDRVLNVTYERRKYVVEPKQTALVPFGLICEFWGDPRARTGRFEKFSDSKEKGWIPKREDELKRLGGKYGTYSEDIETLVAEEWPAGNPSQGTPKGRPHRVSIQTDDGKVIVPVCFDTTGDAVYAAVRNESEDLNDQVQYREHLEQEMDKLKEQMRALQGIGAPDDAEVDSPSGR